MSRHEFKYFNDFTACELAAGGYCDERCNKIANFNPWLHEDGEGEEIVSLSTLFD